MLKYYLFLSLCLLGAASSSGQMIDISLPLNKSVVQRNQSNMATVTFGAQVVDVVVERLQYQIDRLNIKTGAVISTAFEPVIVATPLKGLFYWQRELTSGWYRFTIRGLRDNGSQIAGSEVSVVFGVGEVLYGAGQSNAQGVPLNSYGGPPALSVYDGLVSVSQNCWCKSNYPLPVFSSIRPANDQEFFVGPNGNQNAWFYQVIGKTIIDRPDGIPVAVFNAAATATTVENWSVSAGNLSGITGNPWFMNCNPAQSGGDGPEGHPYRALYTSLRYYGGMFGARMVMWVQGESDNVLNVSTTDYSSRLKVVIAKSREHFHPDLGWSISRVSRFGSYGEDPAVRAGQDDVKNSTSNTNWGAYYADNYVDANDRDSGHEHFISQGLRKLGESMISGTTSLEPSLSLPPGWIDFTNLVPVSPVTAPSVHALQNPSDVTLSVSGSFASYCWVSESVGFDSKICESTSATITKSSGKWRCYVTGNDGRVTLTQSVRIPLALVTVPLGIGEYSY